MFRDSAIPLYYQLETILRQKITCGEFSPKTPLPSEEMLAGEYQVSRITVRQALASLEKEGYIVRQRGRGTFISGKTFKSIQPRLSGTIEDLIPAGTGLQTQFLGFRWIKSTGIAKERLKIADGQKVLRIEKIQNIECTPFSHVYIYLPADIGQKLSEDIVKKKPMLILLEEDLGIRTTEADQFVGATIADNVQAANLGIRVGEPLLKAERTVFDNKRRPIEYITMVFRADNYAFSVKLMRKGNKKSSGWYTV